jgi:hypothetical protein
MTQYALGAGAQNVKIVRVFDTSDLCVHALLVDTVAGTTTDLGAEQTKLNGTITADVIIADIFGITGGAGGTPGTGGKTLADLLADQKIATGSDEAVSNVAITQSAAGNVTLKAASGTKINHLRGLVVTAVGATVLTITDDTAGTPVSILKISLADGAGYDTGPLTTAQKPGTAAGKNLVLTTTGGYVIGSADVSQSA